MTLVFTERAQDDLAALESAMRLRVLAALHHLIIANAGNIKRLQGIKPPEFRLRVGDFRIRFSRPDTDTVRVNRIQHRRDVYR